MDIFFINAFTKKEFKGNPATIVLIKEQKDGNWLQQFAKETNQPITTYIRKMDNKYQLSWFTPAKEIDLCGHGTMGASHVLWSEGVVEKNIPIDFETKAGKLKAEYTKEGIKLEFPVIESTPLDAFYNMQDVFPNVPIQEITWAKDRYIVEVESESIVQHVNPNFDLMKKLDGGVIITTSESKNYDIVSRYFAPHIGVMEDSVTGSAHCALAYYWAKKLNKTEFRAYQASDRGGELLVRVKDQKVEIVGDCMTLIKGTYQNR
ncbi:PhzF family phenazine biosynthesis protein [Radiobacillus deserti]|uniref:PhzF family phenazine biosynthesis protein n=1 Tax=Radiobacillus deserti TaxID=2594883 RepID=A0A516KDC6_9BACI|nr:PhzF family phenazine biosynthesis isomerase [Radiobacillus deserti]QDP39398.1 PhzF family phenazine biosynthesis protein [Radiobacillus deserti]